MATSTESVAFQNISATTAAFTLKGGRYLFNAVATFGGGSVALHGLMADGSTFAAVPDIAGNAVSVTVAGWKTTDLAPGQYKFVIATASAVYCAVASVPG
jgi:hypothetical protein